MSRIFLDPVTSRVMLARFGADPKFPKMLLVIAQMGAAWSIRHVTTKKLLGQELERRTGTGIRSFTASPRVLNFGRLRARVEWGTHLGYMAAHERGFEGSVQVRKHTRRMFRRRGKTGTKLKRKVLVQGRAIDVRAHIREVKIRARYFTRDTVRESKRPIEKRALKGLRIWFRTNRIPTVDELLRG